MPVSENHDNGAIDSGSESESDKPKQNDDPDPAADNSPSREQDPKSWGPANFWLWVFCLLGVDYFSTLSYQPSITYHAAGALGPLATLLVIGITLFAVLPLYLYMAKHSPHGEGSIALVERLLGGWIGKTLILVLLGFAATDFVMLKSISLSDAAQHVLHNTFVAHDRPIHDIALSIREFAKNHVGASISGYVSEQVLVSLALGIVAFFFWFLMRKGFNQRVIALSVPLVGLYLLVNGIVIVSGLVYLAMNPQLFDQWWNLQIPSQVTALPQSSWLGIGWPAIIVLCIILLPQLSLGFSGFEMSMILMPQVRGHANDDPVVPGGRIRNTRKILVLAAAVMSVYLISSVFVTTLLIPAEQAQPGGLASNRMLAYLAHGGAVTETGEALSPLFGSAFGTVFDVCTVLILCFAGTSVMTALALLLPRILLRFGMDLQWTSRWGLMFLWFALINLGITVLFEAEVEHQRGAYATGVLALIFCTAVASLGHWRRHRYHSQRWLRLPWRWAFTTVLFLILLIAVVVTSPSGLMISCFFIGIILTTSVIARALRTHEPRTSGFEFVSEQAQFLWDSVRMADIPILVPHRPGRHARLEKDKVIREDHYLSDEAQIVFIEVEVDDPSNFYQKLMIDIFQADNEIVIKVTQCVSIAHAIAAIALQLSKHSQKPPGLHFGWSELDLLAASWSYLAFGEGNVPWKVRELLMEAEPDPKRRPRVVIG